MRSITICGLFLFSAALMGCATPQLITPANAKKSKIEIDYVLGHSRYRYIASGGENDAEISSYRDEQQIETKKISPDKYEDFALRLEKAIRSSPVGVVDENCRTPYQIKITIEDRTSMMSGCRSADSEGQIGKLLKEGEFLFYVEEMRIEEVK